MSPEARLRWAILMIIGSALYGVLVSKDPEVAQAVMLGYVGILLTIFAICEVWKHD